MADINYKPITNLEIENILRPTTTVYVNTNGTHNTNLGNFRQLPVRTLLKAIESGNFALIKEVTALPPIEEADHHVLYLTKDDEGKEKLTAVMQKTPTADGSIEYEYQEIISSSSVIEDLYGDSDDESYDINKYNQYLDLENLGKQAASVKFVQEALDATLDIINKKLEELTSNIITTNPLYITPDKES